MATYTYSAPKISNSSKSYKQGYSCGLSKRNKNADSNIPKFSKINSVKFIAYAQHNSGYGTGNLYVYWADSTHNSYSNNLGFIHDGNADVTTSMKTYSFDITKYSLSMVQNAGHIVNGNATSIDMEASSSLLYKGIWTVGFDVKWNYTEPRFIITTSVQGGGTVSGAGTYSITKASGGTATLTATPNTGYSFVKWSDGNTNATRTITLTENDISAYETNLSYTAIFEVCNIYVSFDSIFNFDKWKDSGITSGNTATISNITNTGFSITANASDSYTNNSHLFTVTPNTDYILEYDAVGNGHQAYVFCDGKVVAGRFWDTTNGVLRFTVPSDCTTIAIRCDSNISGNTIDYSNIRIYPADYSYMSNSVTATNRSCINSWNFPTPTRTGYDFLGWNTKPDGSGTTYNSSSSFPTSDLVLYSQWKISKINKIYIGTSQPKSIYVGTSEVKAVYVGTTKVYG